MWESPTALWRRLKLGREEYLQRLVTTLILDGDPPPWNTPRSPGDAGRRFLQLLGMRLAHDTHPRGPSTGPLEAFVDEYLLPKLEDDAANGWPDWAVLGPDWVWVIELKTEAGSHRPDQLPYYLRLAAAAHPSCTLDLTYITGPLTKPAPTLLEGQRYSHLTWDKVVQLIQGTWGHDTRPEVAAYLEMVTMLVSNLGELRPSEQRQMVVGHLRWLRAEALTHLPDLLLQGQPDTTCALSLACRPLASARPASSPPSPTRNRPGSHRPSGPPAHVARPDTSSTYSLTCPRPS